MQILDQTVEAIRMQSGKVRVDGARLAATLAAIAECGEQALRIWQDYLANPGAPGDKYSIISWIGAERAKQLHELSLRAHDLMNVLRASAGDQARFLVWEESPIVLAYRGLKEGETGPQAAQAAVAAQQEIIAHVRALADQVRSFKSSEATTKTAKKPAAKKTPAKAAKKAAPKKKHVAKKPARKPAKKAAKKK